MIFVEMYFPFYCTVRYSHHRRCYSSYAKMFKSNSVCARLYTFCSTYRSLYTAYPTAHTSCKDERKRKNNICSRSGILEARRRQKKTE
jgi:hypothetical protein